MPISRIKTDGIQDDAITSAKIGVNVIVADDLAANSVTVSEITNGAVTSAKLDTNIDLAGTFSVADDLFIGSTSSVGNANADDLEITNSSGSGVVGMTFNVNSGSANTGNIYWRSTTSNNNIQIVGDPVSNYLLFATSGVERLRIDANGRIGIGDGSPDAKLDVRETATSSLDIGIFEAAVGGYTGTSLIAANTLGSSNTYNLFKCITDSDADAGGPYTHFLVRGDGNVGIGTTTPLSSLHIDATNGAENYIRLHDGNSSFGCAMGLGSSGDFAISRYNGGSAVEALRVKRTNGHVGLGTAGPQTLLHLYGGDNATSVLTIDATGTGGGRKWSFRPGDPVTPSNGYFSLRDETAGVNRIVITDGGEVRIGGGLSTSSIRLQAGGSICRTYGSTSGSGFHFTSNAIYPTNFAGSLYDANISLGSGSYRYSTIFATNGTINTSDENEKQDIENLSDAERTVATAIKGLIKKFRFIDAVEKKGDDARIHVGVIAQEVEQAFSDAGLDPRRYGMFCEDIWYEVNGEANPDEPYTEDTPGAVRKVRLGIRYDELLAFVISAL